MCIIGLLPSWCSVIEKPSASLLIQSNMSNLSVNLIVSQPINQSIYLSSISQSVKSKPAKQPVKNRRAKVRFDFPSECNFVYLISLPA